MEDFSRESYTSESIGKESQSTTYVVTRGFGDYDLLDLYTDYVVEKVREDMRKKQAEESLLEKGRNM